MNRTSIYIETFGCQMNVADSERAATKLRSAGYVLTSTPESANVILLNTCSVRERAEQKVFSRIGEIRRDYKHQDSVFGVLGCVAQLEGDSLFKRSPSIKLVVGTRALDRLPSLIERLLGGEQDIVDLDDYTETDPWEVSPLERRSRHIAYIPVIIGCNKFCSYCIVPYSRGREMSRPAEDILKEVTTLQEEGYQEIQLLGQNVNSYRPKTDRGLEGVDGATPFSRLLRAVASTGIQRIKFTTSFPRDFHIDIVYAIEENENLCNWVHLPVQSGSDRMLKLMRRGYKIGDYYQRVEVIKNAKRRIALTSDIIIGFPGETREDFNQTLHLVEQCQYDGLYIFKYSARMGTPAFRMDDDVSREEKKERYLMLEQRQKEIQDEIYRHYVGEEVRVLVEGESAKSPGDLTGHTTCHKIINFKSDKIHLGRTVDLRVTEAKSNSLYGILAGQNFRSQ